MNISTNMFQEAVTEFFAKVQETQRPVHDASMTSLLEQLEADALNTAASAWMNWLKIKALKELAISVEGN